MGWGGAWFGVGLVVSVSLVASCNDALAASTYKCPDEKGALVYSDRPCTGNLSESKVRLVVSTGRPTYASAPVDGVEFERQVKDAIRSGRIIGGMSEAEVTRALGEPSRVDNNGGRVVWTYLSAKKTTTVYFRLGVTVVNE